MRSYLCPAALAALSLALSACAGAPAAVQSAADVPDRSAPVYSYVLAGGDKLRITVFGEPDLSGEYVVGGMGTLSLPLIGEVEARGRTPSQLQHELAAQLSNGFLNDPRVGIEVLTARPFYILGEVARPGEYPYTDGLTLRAAVARAGGYTYRATEREVMIQHNGAADAERYKVTPATRVAPGDTIRVLERWF